MEIIESKMWDVLYVPLDYIILNSGFNRDFVVNSLKKMHDYGLVLFKRVPYESYMLTYAGYDVLALKFLVDSNYIIGVNGALGVGKESDVYMGFTPIEEAVVLKFHRLGAVNLHSASRTRGYLAESKNLPWIFRSKISAEREFKILMDVFKVGVSVPMPIVYDRHVVVMSYIEGDPLYVCDFLPDPMETFNMILDEIKLLYVNGGYVHGDLSEYNVIITPELKPIVIDWPQAIKVDDPSANMLLERDIYNIVTFFIKRFRLNLIFEEALSYVLGK